MWSLVSISMSVLFIVEVVCLFLSLVVFSCAYLFSRTRLIVVTNFDSAYISMWEAMGSLYFGFYQK